jgi:hypothetical protein
MICWNIAVILVRIFFGLTRDDLKRIEFKKSFNTHVPRFTKTYKKTEHMHQVLS